MARPVQKEKFIRKFGRFVRRFFIWIIVTALVLAIGLLILIHMLVKGPSPYVKELFVTSAMETSVGGILAKIYLTDEEIAEIQQKNSTEEITELTNTSLIHYEANKNTFSADEDETVMLGDEAVPVDPDGDGIDVFDVKGSTFVGKMMIVYDPSRVRVGVCNSFAEGSYGLTLSQICQKYNAVAGINGGKYDDETGMGTGGQPEGIVFAGGQHLFGDPDAVSTVYGFNNDNILIVGSMSPNYAKAIGIRDSVSFGPSLIVNGKAANFTGTSSGLNPRTAIGQREDGAVLMLVIEGRQSYSVGATYADLIDIMLEYGAVNAANLDGGMSSTMYYNDEFIIQSASMSESRRIPTAFIVLPKEEN